MSVAAESTGGREPGCDYWGRWPEHPQGLQAVSGGKCFLVKKQHLSLTRRFMVTHCCCCCCCHRTFPKSVLIVKNKFMKNLLGNFQVGYRMNAQGPRQCSMASRDCCHCVFREGLRWSDLFNCLRLCRESHWSGVCTEYDTGSVRYVQCLFFICVSSAGRALQGVTGICRCCNACISFFKYLLPIFCAFLPRPVWHGYRCLCHIKKRGSSSSSSGVDHQISQQRSSASS